MSNHPSVKFAPHSLRSALKKGAEAGKFIKVKASFKLAESEKKAPKKVAAKKVAAPTTAAAVKKAPKVAAVKKTPAAKKGCKTIHHTLVK